MSEEPKRQRGVIEMLCAEIGEPFDRRLERPEMLLEFVRELVAEVADMMAITAAIAHVTGRTVSETAGAALAVAELMVTAPTPQEAMRLSEQVHDVCHAVSDDAAPADRPVEMLSACASAVRFGLEVPCRSRHAADAAQQIWANKYGVTLSDDQSPGWQKQWARRIFRRALATSAITAWNRRAPSADADELRQKYQDDMHAAIVEVGRWAQRSGQLEGERDAMAIAFQKLGAVLRVNMLRWVPDTSHCEIDAAIGACLGPVAQRVMSDHVPDAGKMVAPPVVKDCLTTQAAFAAGAAEMRERAAEQVDCGCSWRADALAATNKGERFVACGNDPCGAIEARAIRALPAAPAGEG